MKAIKEAIAISSKERSQKKKQARWKRKTFYKKTSPPGDNRANWTLDPKSRSVCVWSGFRMCLDNRASCVWVSLGPNWAQIGMRLDGDWAEIDGNPPPLGFGFVSRGPIPEVGNSSELRFVRSPKVGMKNAGSSIARFDRPWHGRHCRQFDRPWHGPHCRQFEQSVGFVPVLRTWIPLTDGI